MYGIMICPIKRLYLLAQDGDMNEVAVIAVSSYPIKTEKLNGFCRTLCMEFADTADIYDPLAFNRETADRIADFVKALPCDLDTLFVCCDCGESRSSAMAAAITVYNGKDDGNIWRDPRYRPNPMVYSLLCEAFGMPVTDEQLRMKQEANEKALSDLINTKR